MQSFPFSATCCTASWLRGSLMDADKSHIIMQHRVETNVFGQVGLVKLCQGRKAPRVRIFYMYSSQGSWGPAAPVLLPCSLHGALHVVSMLARHLYTIQQVCQGGTSRCIVGISTIRPASSFSTTWEQPHHNSNSRLLRTALPFVRSHSTASCFHDCRCSAAPRGIPGIPIIHGLYVSTKTISPQQHLS